MNDDVKIIISISREKEDVSVAEELLTKHKQSTEQPKALFLFSTIHYKKEFTSILSIIKKSFSDSPLIGGSVAGFMTRKGCFTRGIVLLSLYGDDFESIASIGHNTKKNPQKAVQKVIEDIGRSTKYDNNVLVEFISTAVIPHIPGMGQQNVILSPLLGNQIQKFVPLMNKLNYGYDRADEILDLLADTYSDRLIIGGCTMDDNKMLGNYQFFNNNVYENSIVAINLSFPNNVGFENILGFKPLNKQFQITELSKDKHIIKKIDGESARDRFFNELNIELSEPKRTHQLFKKSFYYPMGYKKDEIWHSFVIGIIYGDNLIGGSQIKNNDLTLLSLSVGSIVQNIKNHLEKLKNKNLSFLFGFACETFLETLGGRIYYIQEEFNQIDSPFLILFLSGESFYHPNFGCHHLYESLNLFTIEKRSEDQ